MSTVLEAMERAKARLRVRPDAWGHDRTSLLLAMILCDLRRRHATRPAVEPESTPPPPPSPPLKVRRQ